MKKKIALLITTVAITGVGLGTLLTTSVLAQEATAPQNPMLTLVQRISDKFVLKQEDVQAVFDEVQAERRQEMQTRFEERLSQAVSDGKITEEQKQLILAKNKELQAQRDADRDAMKDKTPEERKTAMDAQRQELETWAKENNIDMSYLMGMNMRERGGPGKPIDK